MSDLLFSFSITLIAGLFTGIGGLITLISKKNNTSFLAVSLSFSAGVMIYISFIEIFSKALASLEHEYGDKTGYLITTIAFFTGILVIAVIDKLIPHKDETTVSLTHKPKQAVLTGNDEKSLYRTGLMSALAIAIHNFPEGLVTFMAALQNPTLGVAIAIAIAIHNIPEGIAIASPIYYATGCKKKAVLAAVCSGLTEPLGAIVAYFFLAHMLNGNTFGISFAVVGGIMVYIAIHQLLPTAAKYGKHNQVMKGLFAGMAVMALSLIIFL